MEAVMAERALANDTIIDNFVNQLSDTIR
jgi:hypothetical protein